MSPFVSVQHGSIAFLCVSSWYHSGFFHGFTGSEIDFGERGLDESLLELRASFALKGIVSLRQTHSSRVVDCREGTQCSSMIAVQGYKCISEGDALIAPLAGNGARIGLLLRVADCVPILMRTPDEVVLVHAGWRGIAAGIVQNALSALRTSLSLEVAIGPCAGECCYEVGSDVIDAIGPLAKYSTIRGRVGKYLLSLEGTVAEIVRRIAPHTKIYLSTCCTICSPRYHSYRRNNECQARNGAFAIVE